MRANEGQRSPRRVEAITALNKVAPSINLTLFAEGIDLPSPMVFQRRANSWLSALRKKVREQGISSTRIGFAQFDILDTLRSEMIIRNALALANVHIAQALLEKLPSGRIAIDENLTEFSVCDVARFVENGNEHRIKSERQTHRSLSALHVYAYNAKQSLYRFRRSFIGPKRRIRPHLSGNVLAIPRLPGHLSDILPVAHQLRDRYLVETVFGVVDRGMEREVKRDDFDAVDLLALGRKSTDASDSLISKALADATRLLNDSSLVEIDEFSEAEIKALAYVTETVLRTNLRQLVRVATAMEELVKNHRPSLIFASNPYTLEGRIAVNVARAHRIPTASIEHGTIYKEDPMWAECCLDLMCVWGQPSRRALLSSGLTDQQIAVTGAPRFDEINKRISSDLETRDLRKDNVLVATSGAGDKVSLEEHKAFIKSLYTAASLTPDISWVVKLHKKDNPDLYREVERQFPGARVEVVPSERQNFGPDIFSFLASARAMVTICSTSALDAMLVDVPVVSVAINSDTAKGLEFLERGCTIEANSGVELAAAINKIWEGSADLRVVEAARLYIAEHCTNLGTAGKQVADRIFALMD